MPTIRLPQLMRLPAHPYQKEANRFPLLPAAVVFVTLLGLIALSWRAAERAVEDDKRSTVSERSIAIEASILGRLTAYRDVLHSSRGYMVSQDNNVSRQQWTDFVNNTDITERYPGVLSLGYAPLVPSAQAEEFKKQVKATDLASFEYNPKDTSKDLMPVLYQEPYSSAARPFGFNMLSEDRRKAAIERARDTGMPTITQPLVLVRDTDNPQPAIIMFMPVYEKGAKLDSVMERRESFVGTAFIPFRVKDLMGKAVQFSDDNVGYTVSVNNTEIFRSFENNSEIADRISQKEIGVYGQSWTISYYANDEIVSDTVRTRPSGVVFGGFIFALSISVSVYLLVRRRILDQAFLEQQKLQTAKDDLLSLASHQLRTPATGVKQYLGMVLQGFAGEIDEEQRRFLTLAYESNDRQMRIINEFLYMAKADAGRIIVTPKEFNFSKLVKEVIEEQEDDIQAAGHTLKSKIAKDLIVNGDDHSIRMIAENLISNAIKYTSPNGKILVRAYKEGKKVYLEVTDSGVGINEADKMLLFKQFSRIPNELTQNTSGSGIGLYLSKHLAELNKGDVYLAESTPHKGSTFAAYFKAKTVKNITDMAKRRKR